MQATKNPAPFLVRGSRNSGLFCFRLPVTRTLAGNKYKYENNQGKREQGAVSQARVGNRENPAAEDFALARGGRHGS